MMQASHAPAVPCSRPDNTWKVFPYNDGFDAGWSGGFKVGVLVALTATVAAILTVAVLGSLYAVWR
jgi:hypothetical protein